jgi:hypothetical protein
MAPVVMRRCRCGCPATAELEVLRRKRRSGHHTNAPELLQGQEMSITGHGYLGFAGYRRFKHQIVGRVCFDRIDALGRIGYVLRCVDP